MQDHTRRVRYIDDGHLVVPPADAGVADAERFVTEAEGRTALVLYPHPSGEDIAEIATAWDLHPLLVEDLVHARQRPKLERYGRVLFLVLRSAWYIDAEEEVDFAEFHVLIRPNEVAVLCQDGRWIDGTDATAVADAVDRGDMTVLHDERYLHHGPEGVLYRLLDAIVDGYAPVLRGLEIDMEQIEREVFSGDTGVTERIYRLSQEVLDLRQATAGLGEVVDALSRGFDRHGIPEELQTYLQDVTDHLNRVDTRVTELRESLSQILTVNGTLVGQRQNEDMKKISAWAAILFAPTLIGAVYGMNFDDMPELHWAFGYPFALGLMLVFAVVLFIVFKRQKWM